MNILRRLPLSRLLLLCGLIVAIGVSATALAFALGSGPTPPPKALPQAVHDALAAPPVEGVSASIKLSDHLLEGANLASGSGEASQLATSPLLAGGSGRLWISSDGRMRLELQAERGDTQILFDGRTLTVYDAASNTLYRYTPPAHEDGTRAPARARAAPSVAEVEEAIVKLQEHATLSGATPTNVAGQPAYTARVSPKEGGNLIGGAELSWDAVHGVPLRTALYSSTSSSPVIELTATEVAYGPVANSVFAFSPPSSARVEEVTLADKHQAARPGVASDDQARENVTTRGDGITAVTVLEGKTKPGEKPLELPEGLPKVHVGATTASELPTALGTLLGFERSGVRYLLVGAVTPAAIEAVARGL